MTDDELKALCAVCLKDYDGHDAVVDVARALLERIERERWIPCSERMPTDDNDVLVYRQEGFIQVSAWYDTYWFGAANDVTHWRPLPDAPQREG